MLSNPDQIHPVVLFILSHIWNSKWTFFFQAACCNTAIHINDLLCMTQNFCQSTNDMLAIIMLATLDMFL